MNGVPEGAHAWVFDLIAVDPARRRAALDRHVALFDRFSAALDRSNEIWAIVGDGPATAALDAAKDQASAAQADAVRQTLLGPMDEDLPRALPFIVLWLRWERLFPDEWRDDSSLWSPWSRKARLLRRLGAFAAPVEDREPLTQLVVAAVAGPYRCKDWMYACVARQVDGPELRAQLKTLDGHPDPSVRLRSRFLVHVLDDPALRITCKTWSNWLQSSSFGPNETCCPVGVAKAGG